MVPTCGEKYFFDEMYELGCLKTVGDVDAKVQPYKALRKVGTPVNVSNVLAAACRGSNHCYCRTLLKRRMNEQLSCSIHRHSY